MSDLYKHFMRVDLPEPFGPIIPSVIPAGTVSDKSSSSGLPLTAPGYENVTLLQS